MNPLMQRNKSVRNRFFSFSLVAVLLATASTLGGPATAMHDGCDSNEIGNHEDAWMHVCGGVTPEEQQVALEPHTHPEGPEYTRVCPIGEPHCADVPEPLTLTRLVHFHAVTVQLVEPHGHADVNPDQIAQDVCAILSDICRALGDVGIEISDGGMSVAPAATVPGGPVNAWALSVDGTTYVFPWEAFPGTV